MESKTGFFSWGSKIPTVLETNMMLVIPITKGWFCMAMLVYETVSFVIFVTRFFDWHLSLPKKNRVRYILNQCDFFPKKTTTQIPLFHHHFWASIMSHHVSFKSGRFPHTKERQGRFREGGNWPICCAKVQWFRSDISPKELRWVDSWAMKKTGPLGMFRVFFGGWQLTQIYKDYNKPSWGSLSNNQYHDVCCVWASVDGPEIPNNHPTCMKPCN